MAGNYSTNTGNADGVYQTPQEKKGFLGSLFGGKSYEQRKIDNIINQMKNNPKYFNTLDSQTKKTVESFIAANPAADAFIKGVPIPVNADGTRQSADQVWANKHKNQNYFQQGSNLPQDTSTAPPSAAHQQAVVKEADPSRAVIKRMGIDAGGSNTQANVKQVNMDKLYGEDGTLGRKINEKVFGEYDEFGNRGVGLKDWADVGKAGFDIWGAYSKSKLAEEQFDFQKQESQINMNNQAMITNDQLMRDERWRQMTAGKTAQQADSYVNDDVWKKKHTVQTFKV